MKKKNGKEKERQKRRGPSTSMSSEGSTGYAPQYPLQKEGEKTKKKKARQEEKDSAKEEREKALKADAMNAERRIT